MKNEKKTEVITIRITPYLKSMIEKDAIEKEWSIAKVAEKILSNHYEKK